MAIAIRFFLPIFRPRQGQKNPAQNALGGM